MTVARELFPGQYVELPSNGGPAVSVPFTVWDDPTSGENVTSQLVAPDGVTAYTATTDSQGLLQPFRGPDGNRGPLYIDTGIGLRFIAPSGPAQAALFAQVDALAAAVDLLQNSGIGTGGGGGLPANVTLDDIPNGATRLAMTFAERTRIAGLPATFLQIGTTATTAKAGNYAPTAADVGAVKAVGGNWIFWGGRTTTQGPPTVAEGAVPGVTYAFLDVV